MIVSKKDRDTLRELASQVAEIAALPDQQETISLWESLNGLAPVRPMVMIDQIPWHEMNVDGELTLGTKGTFCRGIETDLRRTLYASEAHAGGYGCGTGRPYSQRSSMARILASKKIEEIAILDAANDVVGHRYFDQLGTEDDLEKIRNPNVVLDVDATARAQETAHEIFDGILDVLMQGLFPMFAVWDRIAEWRSPEKLVVRSG